MRQQPGGRAEQQVDTAEKQQPRQHDLPDGQGLKSLGHGVLISPGEWPHHKQSVSIRGGMYYQMNPKRTKPAGRPIRAACRRPRRAQRGGNARSSSATAACRRSASAALAAGMGARSSSVSRPCRASCALTGPGLPGEGQLDHRRQRQEQRAGLVQALLAHGAVQRHEQVGPDVRGGRDDAGTTQAQGRQRLQILARQHLQPAIGDQRHGLFQRAAAVLDGGDVRVRRQLQQRGRVQRRAGAVGNVVQRQRKREASARQRK